VTLGVISPFAAPPPLRWGPGCLAGLVRRQGEIWNALLHQLDETAMQGVIENRVINEM
jgi:hypothetical protein